jgi:predicted nucleic acid-binding protein
MSNITLKAGQVAAALNISTKRLQNTVDAGYLRPALAGSGRGSERRYSFEDVVRMQALEILVNSYGLSAPRAARMLSDVWPRRFSRRPRVLVIRPEPAVGGVKLEPIRLYSQEILTEYREVLSRLIVPRNAAGRFINLLGQCGEEVSKPATGEFSPDPKDDSFYHCALGGDADYIITDNVRDFPPVRNRKRPRIVTPAGAVVIL